MWPISAVPPPLRLRLQHIRCVEATAVCDARCASATDNFGGREANPAARWFGGPGESEGGGGARWSRCYRATASPLPPPPGVAIRAGACLWLAVGYPSLPHPFALFGSKAEHTSVVRVIHEILYGVHSDSFGSHARVATNGAARCGRSLGWSVANIVTKLAALSIEGMEGVGGRRRRRLTNGAHCNTPAAREGLSRFEWSRRSARRR